MMQSPVACLDLPHCTTEHLTLPGTHPCYISGLPLLNTTLRIYEIQQDQPTSYVQEKQLGQKFIVDATLYCDVSKAGQSDALKDTVNYAAVYR